MTKQLSRKVFIFGLPLLLLVTLIFLAKSFLLHNSPSTLSIAFTLDFLVTIPFLYFLLIRKTDVPKYTVVSLFIVGVIIASFVIPVEQQGFLNQVKIFAVPLVELGLFSFLAYQAWTIRNAMQNSNQKQGDFYDALTLACSKAMPGRVGKLLATEIGVIYYSFFANKVVPSNKNEFTYFRKNGIKTTLFVFLGLVIFETGIVHILVEKWNVTVAWVLTFLGLYTCLQVFALIRSMDKRLISLDCENEILNLRYGFFCQTKIPFHQIDHIEKTKKSLPDDKNFTSLSAVDLLDPHNLIIHLNEKQILHKIYGIEKEFKSIALYVDDVELFVFRLRSATKTACP